MIIDHTLCTHDTGARDRARCRAQRQEIRDEIAKIIERYRFSLAAWNGMSPTSTAEFMMSSADSLAQFNRTTALAAVHVR
jgi:hypothetical protein